MGITNLHSHFVWAKLFVESILGTSCVVFFVVCRPTFILTQEFLLSKDLPSPCIAGGYFFCDTKKADILS